MIFKKKPVLKVHQMEKAQGLPLPTYAHPGDVGMDIPTAVDATIPGHGYAQLETGLKFIIPNGYYLHVYAKGSSAIKGLSFELSIVDEGYTGELIMVAWNKSSQPVEVPRGKAVAQIVLRKYERATIRPISQRRMSRHKTQRGGGRLGSTGNGV